MCLLPALTGLRVRSAGRALGAIILIGSVVALAFYWEAFVSVWCFFAAAASGAILFRFFRGIDPMNLVL
jgi:hypothetical protein